MKAKNDTDRIIELIVKIFLSYPDYPLYLFTYTGRVTVKCAEWCKCDVFTFHIRDGRQDHRFQYFDEKGEFNSDPLLFKKAIAEKWYYVRDEMMGLYVVNGR